MCLSLQLLSWEEGFALDLISFFFFFLLLQKSWLSSSKKNNLILNLIGMPAVSRAKKKQGEVIQHIYSMVEPSLLCDC